MSKIKASDAMIKVIEAWGVKTIYGLMADPLIPP